MTVAGMSAVNGAKLKLTLGNNGAVTAIQGTPQAIAKAQSGVPANLRPFAAGFFGPLMFNEYFIPVHELLDGKEVKVNEPWSGTTPLPLTIATNLTLNYTNTLTGFSKKDNREVAEIAVSGSLAGELPSAPGQTSTLTSTVTGKIVYDINLGILLDNNLDVSYVRTVMKGTVQSMKQTGTYKIAYNVSKVLEAGASIGGDDDGGEPDMAE